YQRDAYVFLRDALDFTTKQQKKIKGATVRHVSGPELLEGVRQYALKEFGPLVMTVFDNWGIHFCEDIGNMVFNLIGAGIFGKTDISVRACPTFSSTCFLKAPKRDRPTRSRRRSRT